MVWLSQLFKYNEHVLKSCRIGTEYNSQAYTMNQASSGSGHQQSNMKGRALLLRLCQSLSFYDQSLKKIVNENLALMTYIGQKAQHNEAGE